MPTYQQRRPAGLHPGCSHTPDGIRLPPEGPGWVAWDDKIVWATCRREWNYYVRMGDSWMAAECIDHDIEWCGDKRRRNPHDAQTVQDALRRMNEYLESVRAARRRAGYFPDSIATEGVRAPPGFDLLPEVPEDRPASGGSAASSSGAHWRTEAHVARDAPWRPSLDGRFQ